MEKEHNKKQEESKIETNDIFNRILYGRALQWVDL
jgi:hypothetical protein